MPGPSDLPFIGPDADVSDLLDSAKHPAATTALPAVGEVLADLGFETGDVVDLSVLFGAPGEAAAGYGDLEPSVLRTAAALVGAGDPTAPAVDPGPGFAIVFDDGTDGLPPDLI